MDVVLNSHIAVLVLGYLYEEKLDHVSKYFCKYSPYLEEEYHVIKKGLRPVIINSDNLSTIVREHCYIKSKVNEVIRTFPSNISAAFDRQTLSGKINHLLKIVKKSTGSSEDENNLKRTRSEARISSSEKSTNTTQIDDLPGHYTSKRRRIADSYMFVRNECSEDSETEEDSTSSETNVENVFAQKNLEDKTLQSKLLKNINTLLKSRANGKDKVQMQTSVDSVPSNTDGNVDEIIQNIIAVSEKDSRFDDLVGAVDENKKNSNEKQKCTNKITQAAEIGNETSAGRLQLEKNCGNETISTEMTSIEKHSLTSKFLVMNSTDFVSTNIQSLSSLKNDQIFFDVNGTQTFPILTSNDGAMYINSNNVPYDTTQPNSFVIVNPIQKGFESSHLIFSTTNTEEFESLPTVEEVNKESVAITRTFSTDVLMSENSNHKSLQSLETQITKDKKTPECKINSLEISINKSLSTPRRKSSHVRVLNFSPLRIINKNVEKQNALADGKSNEKKEEQIDSVLNLETETVDVPTQANENESYNSADLVGDQSNITVIQCQIPLSEDTPKRKTSAISCKRNISRSDNKEVKQKNLKECKVQIKEKNTKNLKILKNIDKSKEIKSNQRNIVTRKTRQTKENEKSPEKKDSGFTKDFDPMEEWKQIREKSKNSNFDQFLREVHSKTPLADAHIQKRRKLRRKIGLKSKKAAIQQSSGSKKNTDLTENNNSESNKNESKFEININKKNNKMEKKSTQEKKTKNVEPKTNFLNFRIKTPIKNNLQDSNSKTRKRTGKMNINKKTKSTDSYISESQTIYIENTENPSNLIDNLEVTNNQCQHEILEFVKEKCEKNGVSETIENPASYNKEKEKRTANIAHILDTPFKVDDLIIPPTPGLIAPANWAANNTITPNTKLAFSSFYNLKNTEIKTPAFAITPGAHLSYSTDKETPRSSVVTDYSSGGSYYKPDDSADLNKKLDRELNEKFDIRQTGQEKPTQKTSEISYGREEDILAVGDKLLQTSNIQNKSTDSIIAEIIPCPVVLNKVKSFSEEVPNVVPHYKFIEAGLPDITDESTTSSSSEESSSNSSKSSSPEKLSTLPNTCAKGNVQPLSLLSNIDSSEDEDWEIQSTSKNKALIGENSQLVSNDGEVRFPVRSWITPKKTEEPNSETMLQEVTSKQDVADSVKLYETELEQKADSNEKMERIKVKLSRNFKSAVKDVPSKETNTQIRSSDKKENFTVASCEISPKNLEFSENQLDVLAALNLSAKKKSTSPNKSSINQKNKTYIKKNLSATVDDNATSEIFTLQMEEESISNESSEVRNAALTLTKMKTKKLEAEPRVTLASTEKENRLHKIAEIEQGNIYVENKTQISGRMIIPLKKCESIGPNPTKLKNEFEKSSKNAPEKLESKKIPCMDQVHLQNLNTAVPTLSSVVNSHSYENCLAMNENNLECPTENQNKIEDVKHQKINQVETAELYTNESESEDEDPYDECEPIFSKENEKNTKHIVCDEKIKKSSSTVHQKLDISKSTMKIFINDCVREISFSEELNLFHLEPNKDTDKIGKQNYSKRKTKCNRSQNEESVKTIIPNKERVAYNKNKEATPLLRKIKISHRNKFSSDQEVARKKNSPINKESLSERDSSETKKTFTNDQNGVNSTGPPSQDLLSKKNIRSEDINAVLSHLYGNGK